MSSGDGLIRQFLRLSLSVLVGVCALRWAWAMAQPLLIPVGIAVAVFATGRILIARYRDW